jgi:hypothetical protein
MDADSLLLYLAIAFVSSCLAGISASTIRNGTKTVTALLWYGIYSGFSGGALFCVLRHYLGPDALLLILGVCIISSLTGHKIVAAINETAVRVARKFGNDSESP